MTDKDRVSNTDAAIPGLHIRLATTDDEDGIAAVGRAVGLDLGNYFSERYSTWVAVVGGSIVGFLEAGFKSDFTGRCVIPDWVEKPHGYLSLLAVAQSHRRRGVATALLRAWCVAAEERGVTFGVGNPAEIEDGMDARAGFFARYGLEPVGVGAYRYLIGATVRDVLDRIEADAR